jgi:hypothetical protein
MRDNMSADVIGAISAPVITTALFGRLEFQSEVVFVWTGVGSILVTGSGDSLMDGNTFDALADGVVQIGANSFTKNGSDELTVTLSVPSEPNTAIAAASVYPSEFRARSAYLWRGLLIPPADPLGQPLWVIRRIRTGKMDHVEITNDGQSHQFILTIESHQANISNASNQTYLNQKRYDPTDTSQDFAVSIANGQPAPSSSSAILSGGSGGGGVLLSKTGEPLD